MKPTLNQADIELLKTLFASKNDLKSLATKADLQKTFELIPVAIDTQLDIKLANHFDKIDVQLTDFRSDMTTKLDKIVSLMEKRDQEVEVLSEHSSDHNDRLETIETKLDIAI